MVGPPMRARVTPEGAKVVSAGGFPVGLELGTERCGEDLAQRPIPARPWHEEVGLGVVEHDERDGANLDHIVPVQCDLREDTRRGLFRPGLVEEEVADTVEDRLTLVHFDPLGPVGVAPARPGEGARRYEGAPIFVPPRRNTMGLGAPVRSVPAPAWAIPASSR